MKYDEFAFFNQQLAAMLRDGIPLEGALHRLCEEMHHGQTRDELRALEADLAKGAPLAEALKSRRLPELYKRMVLVGVKSGDLPGALTMLADYFEHQSNLWTRLKGLMVYPVIVLSIAFLLSCFLSFILGAFIWNNLQSLVGRPAVPTVSAGLWMSPVFIALTLVAVLTGIIISPARRLLRWRLPAFREASLAQVASAMWLMLKSNVPLDDALSLVEQVEKGTAAEGEIAQWRQRLAAGRGKFSEMATGGKIFPPLFVWTVAQSGEDLTGGFRRAAELFHARALYRTELLLYSALPCSILALAAMIMSQIQPVFAALTAFLNALAGNGD
jgi:general secretion pathway protein F/type IV pilus assembly protein PilC